jgi:hypothetical protein
MQTKPEIENVRDFNRLAVLKMEIPRLHLEPEVDAKGIPFFPIVMTPEVIGVMQQYEAGVLRHDPRQLLRWRDIAFAIGKTARRAKQ